MSATFLLRKCCCTCVDPTNTFSVGLVFRGITPVACGTGNAFVVVDPNRSYLLTGDGVQLIQDINTGTVTVDSCPSGVTGTYTRAVVQVLCDTSVGSNSYTAGVSGSANFQASPFIQQPFFVATKATFPGSQPSIGTIAFTLTNSLTGGTGPDEGYATGGYCDVTITRP